MKRFFIVAYILAAVIQSYGIYFHYTPYDGILKEIKTEHFIIVYPKQYEVHARKVAGYAEEVHETITGFFKWKPVLRTTIILSDECDVPNGLAQSALRNAIVLYLSQAENLLELEEAPDTLWNLIVHEYTHILHLDQIRGSAWFWRVIFGKLYIPNHGSFTWNIEGMATLSETMFGNRGRLRSTYNEAMIADAARHKSIPPYDKLMMPYPSSPYGQAVYHFGARFLEYLYTTYGQDKFQEMFIEISKEFFPFILRFVMNFKKIYGKTLDSLWEEWCNYEYEKYSCDESDDPSVIRLTNDQGLISAFDIDSSNDKIYYYCTSSQSDNFIREMSLSAESLPKKLRHNIVSDIAFSDGKLYYVKQHAAMDSRVRNDIYGYNMRTKVETRLTFHGKASRIAAYGETIAYSRSLVDSCELHLASLSKHRLSGDTILTLPNARHIESLSFSPSGDRLAAICKNKSGIMSILLYRLDNTADGPTVVLEDIPCKSVQWSDDDNLMFLVSHDYHNGIYGYNLKTYEFCEIYNNKNVFPFKIKPIGNKIYFQGYTYTGMELFVLDKPSEPTSLAQDIRFHTNGLFDNTCDVKFDEHGMKRLSSLPTNKSTPFHFGRYLYPSVWALIPDTLNSTFYGIPFIAPKLMLIMESPTGRFAYNASITYDYIKQYPQNSLTLTFNLPCTTITASWNNWAGGTAVFNGRYAVYDNDTLSYTTSFMTIGAREGRFPICFSDSLQIISHFPFCDYGFISLGTAATHNYSQWSTKYNSATRQSKYYDNCNTMSFTQSLSFQYIISRPKAERADRGVYAEFIFYGMPQELFDNKLSWNGSLYLLNFKLQFMLPFANAYYFGLIQAGSELSSFADMKEIYSVNSTLYALLQSVPSVMGNTSLNVINGKAFGSTFNSTIKHGGFAYMSFDSGFDISLYNKPSYFHFATLGFRELFMRVYNQYIYLVAKQPTFANFFVDTVLELALKLYAGYDRYIVELAVGATIGYQGTASLPSYGIFFSVNASVGG